MPGPRKRGRRLLRRVGPAHRLRVHLLERDAGRSDPAITPTLDFEAATVADVVHHGLVTCRPDAAAVTIARMMARHRIHALVVDGVRPDTGRGERLVWGVVSDLDLARAAHTGVGGLTAADLAATEPLTIEPSAPLGEAARLMDEHGIGHLIVVNGRRPVGVASTLDIAAALAGEIDDSGGAPEPAMPLGDALEPQGQTWCECEACGGVRPVVTAREAAEPCGRQREVGPSCGRLDAGGMT
jgi:CBS domain-containing protein